MHVSVRLQKQYIGLGLVKSFAMSTSHGVTRAPALSGSVFRHRPGTLAGVPPRGQNPANAAGENLQPMGAGRTQGLT